ncbi:hypothetical protein [Nocardia sp. NPDC127526]|uniref:hypothetical protein n=1 Tax=Nocardia sp. NPDC127526 TaxID=3345393 RepID=UPI00363BBD82
MRTPTRVRAALLFGSLTAATMIVPGPPAAAQTVEFPQVPTFFRPGLCGSAIRSWADTSTQWPGRAILSVQALPVTGYGPEPHSFAPVCESVVTVAWRNMNTGRVGEYRVYVEAGIYGSMQYAEFQDTGPGHVVVTIYTDMANATQRGWFDVPAAPPDPSPQPGE